MGATRQKKRTSPVDPLSLFHRAKPKTPSGRQSFGSGEHAWLGNAGAQDAALHLRRKGIAIDDSTFLDITRMHGVERFDYGELVALSGDFYGSPADLFEERPAPIPWLWEANDLPDLREAFGVELEWIADRQVGRGSEAYPDQNVRMAWNAKSYLELALKNVDHFGWHNVVAYCRHHQAALELAVAAGGAPGERWQRALVYNAFADHFLTDGFAAGHVRVPRAEIRTWAEGQGWSDTLAGALSKLLHDQDGHVTSLHGVDSLGEGLAVVNSRGARWLTFCDGQLFLFPGATSRPEVKLPVSAVSASLQELVLAWKKGVTPKATFSALMEVPFPDPGAPGLAEKFQSLSPRQVDALVKSLAWYAKIPWIGPGLKKSHVHALFAALPELMRRFRVNVVADRARDRALDVRIPKAYLEAFSKGVR